MTVETEINHIQKLINALTDGRKLSGKKIKVSAMQNSKLKSAIEHLVLARVALAEME